MPPWSCVGTLDPSRFLTAACTTKVHNGACKQPDKSVSGPQRATLWLVAMQKRTWERAHQGTEACASSVTSTLLGGVPAHTNSAGKIPPSTTPTQQTPPLCVNTSSAQRCVPTSNSSCRFTAVAYWPTVMPGSRGTWVPEPKNLRWEGRSPVATATMSLAMASKRVVMGGGSNQ